MAAREARSDCAVANALDVLGDRWSLLVVRALLFAGQLRYAALAGSPEAIPPNTLADRLRRLEEAGIVARTRYSDHPPRHSYRLTERGRALGPVLDALAAWGVEHLPGTRRLGEVHSPTTPGPPR